MAEKKRAVAPGIYQSPDGRFSYRVKHPVTSRRTERRLRANTLKQAILEYAAVIKSLKERQKLGAFIDDYIAAGNPDSTGNPGSEKKVAYERLRLEHLKSYLGHLYLDEVTIKICTPYMEWRMRQPGKGPGPNTADRDLMTLSNVMTYAVLLGKVDQNLIKHGRPRFHKLKDVVSCRDHAPRSGEELHRIAIKMFAHHQSEVLGWQMLFEALTGCRTCEVLACRWDAEPDKPGYIEDNQWVHVLRAKAKGRGEAYITINPYLKDCLHALKAWKGERYPESPWYFPSPFDPTKPVSKQALTRALARVSPEVMGAGRHATSHGMRAFYVEWRRSEGIGDHQIAAELGHVSGGAQLVWRTYGNHPPNWYGKGYVKPVPVEFEPAWEVFCSTKKSTSDVITYDNHRVELKVIDGGLASH